MSRIAPLALQSLALQSLTVACGLALAGPAFADDKHDHAAHQAAQAPKINVPSNAKDAVAVVERFSSALATGLLEAAGVELDPNVLILESGGAERSAAEYLGGHAKGDAAFLKAAHIQLIDRTAKRSGDLVWVASKSELHRTVDGKASTTLSTETMIVQRVGTTWKIVHIHWSSRPKR